MEPKETKGDVVSMLAFLLTSEPSFDKIAPCLVKPASMSPEHYTIGTKGDVVSMLAFLLTSEPSFDKIAPCLVKPVLMYPEHCTI